MKNDIYEEGEGTPHNFLLTLIDKHEKQLFIKETIGVGQ